MVLRALRGKQPIEVIEKRDARYRARIAHFARLISLPRTIPINYVRLRLCAFAMSLATKPGLGLRGDGKLSVGREYLNWGASYSICGRFVDEGGSL